MTVLRVLVIAGGLGYIAYTVEWTDDPATGREGMGTLIRSADLGWLLGGLAVAGLIFPLQGVRWYLLLRCRGLNVSFASVMRLTMIGVFFNFCVPVGSTGGDLVRAYGAAKSLTTPGSKAKAIISVVLDRAAGLLGLIVLAAVMAPLLGGDPVGRKITAISWVAMAAVAIGGAVYLHPLSRRWLGLDLLTRFAPIQKLDQAVTGYKHHPWVLVSTILLSVPGHLALSAATGMAGYAIGVSTSMLMLLTTLPIVFIVGSLPLSFMGLGVMEPTAIALLTGDGAGATENQVIAMLMAWRAFLLAYAVIGGALVIGRGMNLTERLDPDADLLATPTDELARSADEQAAT